MYEAQGRRHRAFALAALMLASALRAQDTSLVLPEELRGVPWIINIPEFHDSQRLRDTLGYYGPYVRAYGLPKLSSLTLTDFNDRWQLVGVVLVDTWTDAVTPNYSVAGTSPIPELLASPRIVPDWRHYSALGLKSIWNCVFLRHTGTDQATGWQAIIGGRPLTPGGIVSKDCTPAAGATPMGTPLKVIAEAPSRVPSDYPPVARIIALDRSYGLGFRCAVAWCNILPNIPGVTLRAATHAGMSGMPGAAQWKIKGWFDDQDLATPEALHDRSSGLRPAFYASLIPDAALKGITLQMLEAGERHVATVYIAPGSSIPAHYKKWGFVSGRNEIYIQMGDAVFGRGTVKNSSGKILAQLIVHRHSHREDMPKDVHMAATARWAWTDDDDPVWIECDEGCCYIDAK